MRAISAVLRAAGALFVLGAVSLVLLAGVHLHLSGVTLR
jgi:hypothetical protein